MLFQDKVTAFNESVVAPKKKRKTFVPPFGAAITEAKFRELIMEKETAKQSIATLALPSTSSNSQSNKRKPFKPPNNKSRTDQQPQSFTTSTDKNTTEMRGQGPKKRSSKGKAPEKKSTQNEQVNRRVEGFEDSLETIEEDNCVICGKFQMDSDWTWH